MKIDIWSDVRCPFCYIGKRKFEMALDRFAHKDKTEVVWHSFQLDPNLETRTDVNAIDYIADVKGFTREHAEQLHDYVTDTAEKIGLAFRFDQMVVANSLNAHRLIQFAKSRGLGSEAEEQLFKAHFTEGKNIDDRDILCEIGLGIGLPEKELLEMLRSDAFSEEVREDELAARSLGIRGVPFFIMNNKYAISGAQSPEVFSQTLEQSWMEYEKEKEPTILEGDSCTPDGLCD